MTAKNKVSVYLKNDALEILHGLIQKEDRRVSDIIRRALFRYADKPIPPRQLRGCFSSLGNVSGKVG